MMTMTTWSTLMSLAHELGQARLSGDENRIEKAEKEHEEYRQLCLKADGMILSCDKEFLDNP